MDGGAHPGGVIRAARLARGWTQEQLAAGMHVSAATVSRWETGTPPLRDVQMLRGLADVLGVAPEVLGVATTVSGLTTAEDDDPVRRRELLRSLTVTAAATAASPIAAPLASMRDMPPGDQLIGSLRAALLGPSQPAPLVGGVDVARAMAAAIRQFQACRYERLAVDLPRLIATGHDAATGGDPAACGVLAEIYTLATRMLIKLDCTELGLVAADRAQLIAKGSGDPVPGAEAARNLSVLTRKAGWYDQSVDIALAAAADPQLRGTDPRLFGQRGLLVMSAAYTVAKRGDRKGMRELAAEAQSITAALGSRIVLPSHGGGFGGPTVDLHLISANNACVDPSAALKVAHRVNVRALPTVERRSRYWGDVATSYALLGRRDECLDALLAAERAAPQETHARPAIRALVNGLLTRGRLTPELRALAARCSLT